MTQFSVFVVLMFFAAMGHAADSDESWSVADVNFKVQPTAYDQTIVEQFGQIVWDYQKTDPDAFNEQLKLHENSENKYKEEAQKLMNKRAVQLQEKEAQLFIIYKERDMIGGTFAKLDRETKTVRITCAGFKINALTNEEYKEALERTLSLFKKKRFDDYERVIAFVHEKSRSVKVLEANNFNTIAHNTPRVQF